MFKRAVPFVVPAALRWVNSMSDKLKIGVVVADTEEYRPFGAAAAAFGAQDYSCLGKEGIRFKISGKSHSAEVVAVLCGIGKVNAATAAAVLATEGCDIMLNYGLSGGISRARRGQLVLADRFLEHDFDLTPLGFAPCEKPEQRYIYTADTRLVSAFRSVVGDITAGTAVCGDRFISNDEDRLFFKENFDAVSCDMETAAIASVCDMADIPFVALRRISDDAGDDACDSYREMNTSGETVLSDIFIDCIKAVADEFGGDR